MKFIVLFAFAVLVYAQAVYSAEEEWKCEPGVPYKENECNGCFCTENHLLGCTEMACLGSTYRELFDCEVGTTFEKGCNKCVCVKGLGTICTNHKC